jgi:hypothetical protein
LAQCAAHGHGAREHEPYVMDIEVYLQCLFTQLDLLQQWVGQQLALAERAAAEAALQQAQQAQRASGPASAPGSGSRGASNPPEAPLPPFVARVASVVGCVPIQTMAQAALK